MTQSVSHNTVFRTAQATQGLKKLKKQKTDKASNVIYKSKKVSFYPDTHTDMFKVQTKTS